MSVDIQPLTGDVLRTVLPALAELRIRVFAEWPYLYNGTLEYEQKYLEKFSQADHALVVVARDGDRVIGASTASPLLGHADEFAIPFKENGYDPQRVFYFGESVLLPEYRGRGIGHAFFEHREQHARHLGRFDIATFCAVVRATDDPRKPVSYNPLDPFWHKRGFHKMDGMITSYSWKEIDTDQEIEHPMQFWVKRL
jgi:GNAT superfamily N-acetyltransferase